MRSLRWFLLVFILICFSPILLSQAGELAAYSAGCGSIEDEFFTCVLHEHNLTDMLRSLIYLQWLTLWGVVAALAAGSIWLVAEIMALTIGRGSSRLRF